MSLAQPLLQGIAGLIDNAAIAEFAGVAGKKAVSVLKAHFTFSAHEITSAYQDSFAKSLEAINNIVAQKKSWFSSKLNKEFYEQFSLQITNSGIQTKALLPFIATNKPLFQIDSIQEADLASLINTQSFVKLSDLLLEQMQQIAPLDDNLISALRHDDLLAKTMLFFLREQFRTDARFEKTLLALQQEAILFNQQRILGIMEKLENLSQTKASDEFTQHNSETRSIIQKSVLNLQKKSPDLATIPILTPTSQYPEMVSIPAGTFQMGSNELSMESFAIGKYQVTFAEYDKFVEATGIEKPSDEEWGRENRPVINVSAEEATAYANWLSEQTGDIYRLPTEAEWEYSARAGAKTCYCFGNDYNNLDDYAWYWYNWYGKTHRVGAKKPNAWGLYDVHGNVWEWTSSEYYENNSEWLVLRGGSWNDTATWTELTFRKKFRATARSGFNGFRLVRLFLK